jgi:acetyl-CoA decarbonylase/synthase complex subunit gamma
VKNQYIVDWLDTAAGKVPVVPAPLNWRDRRDGLLVRLSFRRMNYKVEPGLYALGKPGPDSVVLVSANYKLSFDALRKELRGLDAWILVIDTKGINVWCAAGKGTFGTEELIHRLKITELDKIVKHRRIVVPQLGAPGVAAHEVKKESGFNVVYGPVQAADIPAFLEAGMKTTADMRRVRFNLKDRMMLVPVETVMGVKYLVFIIAVFFLLSGLNRGGFSLASAGTAGLRSTVNLVLAYLAGVVLGPMLLPWLPARQFFIKGFYTGLLAFGVSFLNQFTGSNILEVAAWFLLVPALSSFLTMNFTGASTYTSLSGVKKEMSQGVPLQAAASVLGAVLWLTGRFVYL